MENPSWSFYGPNFPGKQALLDQRNHVFAKHPHTTFIALHVANWPENLDTVSGWLQKVSKYVCGIWRKGGGAGQAATASAPNSLRNFRIASCSEPMRSLCLKCMPIIFAGWRPHDEYFPYWGYPGQGRWMIYGMELNDTILEKVYHGNAEKIFSRYRGEKR